LPYYPHEDVTSRLPRKIDTWRRRLEKLSACAEYARVPEGFWKSKGKQLVDKLATTTPEKAIEVAASYLKNPLAP
jgi:hypothetical protein